MELLAEYSEMGGSGIIPINVINALTPEQLAEVEKDHNSPSYNHPDADNILQRVLVGLGHTDLVVAYQRVAKWYD